MKRILLWPVILAAVSPLPLFAFPVGLGGGGAYEGVTITGDAVFWASSDVSGIYRSEDRVHWVLMDQRDLRSPDGRLNVVLDPNEPSALYSFHPYHGLMAAGSDGAPGNWFPYGGAATLPTSTVSSMAIWPFYLGTPSDPHLILLGTDAGVFKLQTVGSSQAWQRLGTLNDPAGNPMKVVKVVYVKDTIGGVDAGHAFAAVRCSVIPTGMTGCNHAFDGIYSLSGTTWTGIQSVPNVTDFAADTYTVGSTNYYMLYAANGSTFYRFSSDWGQWLTSWPLADPCFTPKLIGHQMLAPFPLYLGNPSTKFTHDTIFVTSSGSCANKAVYIGSFTMNTSTGVQTISWQDSYSSSSITNGWLEASPTIGGYDWTFGGDALSFAVDQYTSPSRPMEALFGNFAELDYSSDANAHNTSPAPWRDSSSMAGSVSGTWRTAGADVTSTWNYYHSGARRFIANTDIGLSVSDESQDSPRDGAPQWRPVSTLAAGARWENFYEMAFNGTQIWAAVSHQHDIPQSAQLVEPAPSTRGDTHGTVLLSTDNGSTWASMGTGLPGDMPVVSILYTGGVLWASVWNRGVYQATPNATTGVGTWTQWGTPPAGSQHFYQLHNDAAGNVYVVVAATTDSSDNVTTANTGALYRLGPTSSSSWTQISGGTLPVPIRPMDFTFDPADSSVIYLATADSHTTPSGGLWKLQLTAVGGTLSTAASLANFSGTTEGGISGTQLFSATMQDFLIGFAPKFIGSTLYLTTIGHGIVQSLDHGTTWTHAFPSLRFLAPQRIFDDNGQMYLTTFGNGVQTLASPVVAINSGGGFTPSFSGPAGLIADSFAADTDFSGGSTGSTTAFIELSNVSYAKPQAMYQTERTGTFTYTIPGLVPNELYTVRLHFAEISFTGANQRLFNVLINGAQVLTNFDIFAAAGAANTAVVEQFTALANTSGQIVIAYQAGAASVPKSSGIEIFTASAPVIAINAGSTAIAPYVADTDFSGGTPFTNTATVATTGVAHAAPAAVYQTGRFGSSFTYQLPTPGTGVTLEPGVYTVRLHFAEPAVTGTGQRLFNVAINGNTVLSNFDVFKAAGGQNKALVEEFSVDTNVTGAGFLTISFTSGSANLPMVSGVEILREQ